MKEQPVTSGGVALGECPEFKLQYCKKIKRKRKENKPITQRGLAE
jgi:hypothetical protein